MSITNIPFDQLFVQAFEHMEKALANTAQDIADFVLFEADNNLSEGDFAPAKGKGAFDTGSLADTGRIEKITIYVWLVVYDAPHALFVEFGTRPHYPPLSPLIIWSKRKFNLSLKEAVSRAKKIQKTIGKYGTHPRPFFRRATAKITPALIDRLVRKNITL